MNSTSGYSIFRNDSTSYFQLSSINSSISSFYDATNLISGVDYIYKLQSFTDYDNGTIYRSADSISTFTISRLNQPVLSVSDQVGGISIAWPAIPGATSYSVIRSPSFPTAVSVTSNSYIDTNVVNDVTYTYNIIARRTTFSSAVSASTPILFVAAPTLANIASSIVVSWLGNAGATSYNIWKLPDDNNAAFSTGIITVSTLTDSLVNSGTLYSYAAESVFGSVSTISGYTNIRHILYPRNFVGSNVANGLAIAWDSSAVRPDGTRASQYSISRNNINYTTTTTNSLNDTGVLHGTTYTYKAIVVDGVYQSSQSDPFYIMYLNTPILENVSTSIRLSWTSTIGEISSYNIFRNGSFLSSIVAPASEFIDRSSTESGTSYTYSYSAVSTLQFSETVKSVTVTIIHLNQPTLTIQKTANGQNLFLSWTQILAADFYQVYKNSNLLLELTSDATSYIDPSVVNGQTYSYYVYARKSVYLSEKSNTQTITFFKTPTATTLTTGIRIDWSSVPSATSYEVYKISGLGPNILIHTAPVSELTYTDTSVVNGDDYVYEVRVILPGPTSLSMGSVITRFVNAPQNFQINLIAGVLQMTWDPVPGTTSYSLYNIRDEVIFTTSNTFTSQPTSTTYAYYVRAFNGGFESGKSSIKWKYTTPTPPGFQNYPGFLWNRTIQATGSAGDMHGSPATVVGPDDRLYFANAVRGPFETLTSQSTHVITLGCLNQDGTTRWVYRSPLLTTINGDFQPVLTFGTSGELYLAYSTTGSVPDRYNMTQVVGFCGICGTSFGQQEIVLARIDGVLNGSPTVRWRIQDANINSCSNEFQPKVVYDPVKSRIILVYQTDGRTLCANRQDGSIAYNDGSIIYFYRDGVLTANPTPSVGNPPSAAGSPNIVVNSIDVDGVRQWTYQYETMNSSGQNRDPSITVDSSGNVYIAYTVNTLQNLSGAGSMVSNTDVQLVKIHGEKPYENVSEIGVRDWILSARANINAPNYYIGGATSTLVNVFNTTPAIACDLARNVVYLAYKTTGTVDNGQKISDIGLNDIVFSAIRADGTILWTTQNFVYNQLNASFDSEISMDVDIYGVPYIGVRGTDVNNTSRLVFFRLNPDTGAPAWEYAKVTNNIYLLNYYIATPTEFSAISSITSAPSYSVPSINIAKNSILFIAVNTEGGKKMEIVAVNPTAKYNQTGSGTITNVD